MKLLLNCNDALATWCHLQIFSAVIFNAGFLSTGVDVVGSAPCFPPLSLDYVVNRRTADARIMLTGWSTYEFGRRGNSR